MKLRVDKDTCVQKGGKIGRETVSLFQFSDDKIDFTYKCQTCDCNENKILNAPECSTKGTLICGVCQCNEGFKGNICTKGLFSYAFIVFLLSIMQPISNIFTLNDKADIVNVKRVSKRAMINAVLGIVKMVENASVVNANVNLDLTAIAARLM